LVSGTIYLPLSATARHASARIQVDAFASTESARRKQMNNANNYRHFVAEVKDSDKTIEGQRYALILHRIQDEDRKWYGYAVNADSRQLVAEALGATESELRQNLADEIKSRTNSLA
jgi:hypothetical protein